MNRRLGQLSYARALLQPIEGMDDDELLQYLHEFTIKLPQNQWPLRPIVVRALLLEFSVGFAKRGKALPEELVVMLADQMKLPRDFLEDPQPVYSGDRRGPNHRQVRELMFELDAESAVSTGKPMTQYAMQKRLKELTGQTISRDTLVHWRDNEWEEWLEVAAGR